MRILTTPLNVLVDLSAVYTAEPEQKLGVRNAEGGERQEATIVTVPESVIRPPTSQNSKFYLIVLQSAIYLCHIFSSIWQCSPLERE